MSRGDPIYMKVDLDILEGGKFSQLTANERDTFVFGLWRLAVKRRKSTGTFQEFSWKFTGNLLEKDWRTTRRHYVKFHTIGLITLWECGSVTVHKVRECHSKLSWKDDRETSPYGAKAIPRILPVDDIVRQLDSKTGIYTPISSDTLLINKTSSDFSKGDPDPEVIKNNTKSDWKEMLTLDPILIQNLASEILRSLRLPDEAESEAEQLCSDFPHTWIIDALHATRDKQIRIASECKPNFTSGPLEYLTAILERKLKEWRNQ